MNKKTIVLDTNFLRECIKNKIHIEEELDRICHYPYTIKITEATIRELEQQMPHPEAKLALAITKKYERIEGEGGADDILAEISSQDVIIATQDKELKKRLKGPKIVLRQKKYLELK